MHNTCTTNLIHACIIKCCTPGVHNVGVWSAHGVTSFFASQPQLADMLFLKHSSHVYTPPIAMRGAFFEKKMASLIKFLLWHHGGLIDWLLKGLLIFLLSFSVALSGRKYGLHTWTYVREWCHFGAGVTASGQGFGFKNSISASWGWLAKKLVTPWALHTPTLF